MIKKILINISIVLLLVIILDFFVGKTLERSYFNSGENYLTKYSIEETEADILIFGSSRANHQYIPNIFEDTLGLSTYNVGRSGMNIFYFTAILESVLKRYTPKIIILDFIYLDFEASLSDYDRIATLLPYYHDHEEIRDIIELKNRNIKIMLMSHIYQFNSGIIDLIVDKRDIVIDNKGYIPYKKQHAKNSSAIEINNKYDPKKISYFTEFLANAKDAGAELYVVYSPVLQQLNTLGKADPCKDMCTLYNIPVIDYSQDSLFLNNKCLFYDNVHLNNDGALKFSKLVAARIKKSLKNISPKTLDIIHY